MGLELGDEGVLIGLMPAEPSLPSGTPLKNINACC